MRMCLFVKKSQNWVPEAEIKMCAGKENISV
jgi:hypothetical protein